MNIFLTKKINISKNILLLNKKNGVFLFVYKVGLFWARLFDQLEEGWTSKCLLLPVEEGFPRFNNFLKFVCVSTESNKG
jgi:hypothetical protein